MIDNINQDEMTPKQRMKSYITGERVDRLPVQLMLSDPAPTFINEKVCEYYFDSEIMLRAESYKADELGFESLGIGLTLRGLGEALGTELKYFSDRSADVKNPVLTDYSNLGNLSIINPKKSGRIPIIIEANKKIQEKYGKTHNISCSIPGPLSAAHAIVGEVKLLRDVKRDPENVKKLLDFVVECLIVFAQELYNQTGIPCSISHPFASSKLISPEVFEQIDYPYLKKMINRLIDISGNKPSIHLCGKSNPNWELYKTIEFSATSIDNIENLENAKNILGEKFMIVGNIDPVQVIRYGNRESIFSEVKRCLKEAADSPNGYLVGSGCDIPSKTPVENFRTIIEATRYYTKGIKKGEKIIFEDQLQ